MADSGHARKKARTDAAGETMQAVWLTGAGQATVCSRPRPQPGPGDALVRVALTGVCGTDIEILEGTLGYFEKGLSEYPLIPGHEWCGTIEAVGADIANPAIKPGSRVVGEVPVGCGEAPCAFCPEQYNRCLTRRETGVARLDGGFAQYMVVPATSLHVLADHVPFEVAVSAEPLAVSQHAVERAQLQGGEWVSVHGDGPIGLLILQIVRTLGCPTVVIGANETRLSKARELGASHTFDVRGKTDADALAFLRSCDPAGKAGLPTCAFEASGHVKAIELAVRAVTAGGKVMLVGLTGGKTVSVPIDPVVLDEVNIMGCVSATAPHWRAVVSLLESNAIQSIVTHRLPLAKYSEAIAMLRHASDHPGMLKVVLDPSL